MNESHLKNVIEAALFAAGRPLTVIQIAQLFDEHVRPTTAEVRAHLAALAADYATRGIEMKETASGFRVQIRGALASEISRLWPERPPRFSRALLETLALIAYRQPITRAEIEAVRGVAVNPNIVKTLLERNWIRIVGQRDVPGHPELLGTTREFLDYFGLKTLAELPPLAALTAMADVNLQLDLDAGARAASAEDAGTGATAMLDEDGAEDDEDARASAAASELVAAADDFER
jgi:segregation and condensation protein B